MTEDSFEDFKDDEEFKVELKQLIREPILERLYDCHAGVEAAMRLLDDPKREMDYGQAGRVLHIVSREMLDVFAQLRKVL